ncbi:uncharacterized protein LOC142319988 [Lycorma delicatula]|uniref:uncharacterized protein LOC142319988 n=1 Tax=Lycorma delicatula TaxID=130591 RepID=UPI003F518F7D
MNKIITGLCMFNKTRYCSLFKNMFLVTMKQATIIYFVVFALFAVITVTSAYPWEDMNFNAYNFPYNGQRYRRYDFGPGFPKGATFGDFNSYGVTVHASTIGGATIGG